MTDIKPSARPRLAAPLAVLLVASFLINVPICLAALGFGISVLPADARRARSRLDLPGVALLSAAVPCLVIPLTLGADTGWSAGIWVGLAASIPCMALFVLAERHALTVGRTPLLNTGIFRRPAISLGTIGLGSSYATYFALLFILAQYLQTGLHHSALFSGLILVPWAAALASPDSSAAVSPRICSRHFRSLASVCSPLFTWPSASAALPEHCPHRCSPSCSSPADSDWACSSPRYSHV
jgi:hypothetical protein